MRILIYQDYIHNNGVLYRALCRHFGTDHVGFCDAEDIIEGDLDGSVDLLVMPGGGDLYYAEKLNGKGNTAIRRYVENGGTYLGICAGAYYGCTALEWAKDTPAEISGPRELSFFVGTATGPFYSLIEDEDINKSWQGITDITWHDDMESSVLYHAGPAFIPAKNAGNYTVLARYNIPDNPAAIVKCSVGAGQAILCGPHLEYTATDIKRQLYTHKNASYEWERLIADQLQPHETLIHKLWMKLLQECVERS